MSEQQQRLWKRRCSVLLLKVNKGSVGNNPSAFVAPSVSDEEAWELADMHVIFNVMQADVQTPDAATIRIENLSPDIVSQIQEEYQRVVLQAGYWNAPYGVIFTGSIVQFRKGREEATTYLEILARDSDEAYNTAFMSQSLVGGHTAQQVVSAVVESFKEKGVQPGELDMLHMGGVVHPRGKVLVGLTRAIARQVTNDRGASWNILKGKLNITMLDGYLPGEAVELSSKTGLIGRAQQTESGIECRCLINPQIRVGGLVRLNNAAVNVLEQAPEFAFAGGQQPFDRYTGIQTVADVAADGLYRVFEVEYHGDTRGQNWYSDLTLLAVDPVSGKVKPQ